jgi:hypothetical protein
MIKSTLTTFLCLVLSVFSFFSCSKSSNGSNSSPGPATVTFTVGDSTYTVTGDFANKLGAEVYLDTSGSFHMYELLAYRDATHLLNMFIWVNKGVTLAAQTYTLESAAVGADFLAFGLDSVSYSSNNPQCVTSFTITRIHDKMIDGTFYGTLYSGDARLPINPADFITITNGSFRNVKIVQ